MDTAMRQAAQHPERLSSRVLAGPLHRARLDNGLRILVAPDRSAPVVAVAVMYDVGHRTEPEGSEGLAHLFEHLMFQGSENLEKLAHARYVHACGGSFNGTTHRDHTSYYQVLSSGALELALFLEADRMRAPLLTEKGLANQVAVVGQEFRRKILDNPYGGLPSPYLPAVMFDDFANAHDGWGAVERLRTVTLGECRAFFEKHYSPANALLVVCGDAEPDLVAELAERHFGPIPAGTAPLPRTPVGVGGAPSTGARHTEHHHPAAVLPALCAGWRLPDPAGPGDAYASALLLAEVLTDGADSLLQRRLIHQEGRVSQLSMAAGSGGRPFESRDPDALALVAMLHPGTDPQDVLSAVYEELEHVADNAPAPELLARVATKWATAWARSLDPLGMRVQRLGAFELLHAKAELALELPTRIRQITPSHLAGAAAALADQPRRWVTVASQAERQPSGTPR